MVLLSQYSADIDIFAPDRRSENPLKNIQVIDGAGNATFGVFRATESEFEYLFPNPGQDIELVEDFFARHHETFAAETLNNLWLRPIHKSKVQGIHGTLFYDYVDKRHHLPASKREIDRDLSQINPAQRELYARLRAEDSDTPDTVLPITRPELLGEIAGGPQLLEWFGGHAPSFHDAEVLTLALDRENARCNLRIHAFSMTPEVDDRGFFITKNHVVAAFRFEGVFDLELMDFNEQNAIYSLSLSRTASHHLRLEMEPAYGLNGFIEATQLNIELEPGIPQKSIYQPKG
jgi:hypothetical protein